MVAYVIIPGIGGSEESHWQTHWETEWGGSAVRISPLSWSRPVLQDWVEATDRAVTSAAVQDRDVILVAHSLGCWAASEWLSRAADDQVIGAFLVAPPDPSGDAFPTEAAASFLDVTARALRCRSMVVASTNDPYCRLETASRLADDWGSELKVVGALGHINTASRLGYWPQGHRMLESLVRE